jgi:hypothetical protein
MYPIRMVRQPLRLALLVTLVVLAISACGGGGSAQDQAKAQKEQAKSRPLPQDLGALHPGEYHSVVFKPSLSFKVGKGWLNTETQLPDFIEVGQPGEGGWILFANVKEVYKRGTLKVVKAPEDLVGWFQEHPYLKTSKPESVTVGGVEGEQIDMVVEVPEGYYGACGSECMDIYWLGGGEPMAWEDGDRVRIIVLDVKGETVTVDSSVSEASEFDEFMTKAQKVVDSVKWTGS